MMNENILNKSKKNTFINGAHCMSKDLHDV